MSTLTIKLNKKEVEELDKLKVFFQQKTSTGCIRVLINRFKIIDDENTELMKDNCLLRDNYKKLMNSGQNYFNAMHQLMKDSEFEQKL